MFFQEGKGWLLGVVMVVIIGGFIAAAYVQNFAYPLLTGVFMGCCGVGFILFSIAKDREGF
jgi:hypothetical protein